MERSNLAKPIPLAMPRDEKNQSPPIFAEDPPDAPALAPPAPGQPRPARPPSVFVFNPFAEGYIAQGQAFTPVKPQAQLAADLANLPQFLGQSNDILLSAKRPSPAFLIFLKQAGFPLPEFVELREGRLDPADRLDQRTLDRLRPWAWAPDSVKLLEPLLARTTRDTRTADQCFNDHIARLYSKAWSADFLRKILAHDRESHAAAPPGTEAPSRPAAVPTEAWLCSGQEVGMAVDTFDDALRAIAAIRCRGHQRVVVKEAYGLAGHNALRLWERELLPAQRRWLAHALEQGRPLVVEPWLERELDFSVQLEMGPRDLTLRGYTGLINDPKGQFLANWAEADYRRCLPARVAALLGAPAEISGRLQRLYDQIFSLLEMELRSLGFIGPVSIDALVYRAPTGDCRLKPVVEINPRYTMGRLTVELMKHACSGSCGLFRLVTQSQARVEGFAELASYASALGKRLRLEDEAQPRIRQGALCLNDPSQAQVCLATFEVSPTLTLPRSLSAHEPQRSP